MTPRIPGTRPRPRPRTASSAPAGHRGPAALPAEPVLTRGLLLLLATATGLSCAGNYFAQPLLDLITRDLGVSATLAGLVVTASQAGYALGLMLLLPLGDVRDRRRLAVGLFLATAAFLALTAASWSGPLLLAGTLLTAVTSVGAQVLVAHATSLSAPADRGRTVGTVMAGIILGGLLARAFSGTLSELGGWRTAYWVDAVLMATMALILSRRLPSPRPTPSHGTRKTAPTHGTGTPLRYAPLLRSTLALLRTEPALRRRALLGALSMASYSAQLTGLTFLLTRPPFGWSEAEVGLFGLVGAVGVLTASSAGRLGDRGHVRGVTTAGVALFAGGWLLMLVDTASLAWLAAGVVTLNIAQQCVLGSSQYVIYGLRPDARGRINSAFMTSYFTGGATGSALGSLAWAHGGWGGVCLLGLALSAATAVPWLFERAAAARATA
ncbi:MFS transporter [Streptomyces sp. NPDC050560]|uniref:MFS transporter n=1 Tax=Streptomyces sp. NPDC050560 TaxID=3365630 RepID=UPI003793A35F